MSDEITVSRSLLQSVFDVAVNSMDFGSGFLDDEEVEHLRAIALALGVDPIVGTPSTHRCRYERVHEQLAHQIAGGLSSTHCIRCRKALADGDAVRLLSVAGDRPPTEPVIIDEAMLLQQRRRWTVANGGIPCDVCGGATKEHHPDEQRRARRICVLKSCRAVSIAGGGR